ncbi:MAG: hypothetical protein QNJ75_09930 [Acidimicrobiia bacterium]|nr:hypothetical protein [Acidimicrobiia bacterium]
MNSLLAALLVLLPLSAPFGEASATASSVDDGLWIEVSVEVSGSPVAVVVRGIGPGGSELPPVALADRGNGRWEGVVSLPVIENILIGFESIPAQGPTEVSEFNTLTELGVDRAIFSFDNPDTSLTDDDDESLVTPEAARWGWLGMAAGAAALALIALWTIGAVRGRGRDDDSEDEVAALGDPDEGDASVVDGGPDDPEQYSPIDGD